MNWINIHTAFIRSPEFIGAEPVERATWLCLLAYCCEQENGGTIAECDAWKCRRWQQTCGVSLEEVMNESELWEWTGKSLIVHSYPADKEREVSAKRKAGKLGGRPKTVEEKTNVLAPEKPYGLPDGLPDGSNVLKRKGKERKGKEGERKGKGMEVKAKNPPPQKHAHGEFSNVMLTEDEHQKLIGTHGDFVLAKGIAVLDDYIESKGAKYKSHYAVLKSGSWVWDRVKASKQQSTANQKPVWN